MPAFWQIIEKWQQIHPRLPGGEQARLFLVNLTSVLPGGPAGSWLKACRQLVAGEAFAPDKNRTAAMWKEASGALQQGGDGGGNDLLQSASIMLACARALRDAAGGEPDPQIWEALATPHYPLRAVLDTVAELRPPADDGEARGGTRRMIQQFPVVFVCGEIGVPATLELELLAADRWDFWPAFPMALTAWDGGFAGAMENARAFLNSRSLWPKGCGVRWRVTFLDGKKRSLFDGSLGAALSFGVAWLAALHELIPPSATADRLRAVHHPQAVCLSAGIAEDGALDGIGLKGVLQKIHAALRDERVEILILPETALATVADHFEGSRSAHSPNIFRVPRAAPNARPLTIVCEAQLFLP